MMYREKSRRMDLARSALIHALGELEDHHWSSACGLAFIAAMHLSHLCGESGLGEIVEACERVRAEGRKVK